jgi:hypothetical protein
MESTITQLLKANRIARKQKGQRIETPSAFSFDTTLAHQTVSGNKSVQSLLTNPTSIVHGPTLNL